MTPQGKSATSVARLNGDAAFSNAPALQSAKAYRGRLRVRVLRGTDLKKSDLLTPSDGYVVLKVLQETYTTKTIRNTPHPVWDETAVFSPEVFERHGLMTCPHTLSIQVHQSHRVENCRSELSRGLSEIWRVVSLCPC